MFESVSTMKWDISKGMMYMWIRNRFQPGMIFDSYKNSRQMHPESLDHPLDIRDSFDSITYSKGKSYFMNKLKMKLDFDLCDQCIDYC